MTGRAVTYGKWLPGEPNNSGGLEHYAEFYPNQGWNDTPWNRLGYGYIPGLVEVSVKDIEKQQEPILKSFLAWVEENNALDKIPEIARQILDPSTDNLKYKEQVEALQTHLAEYDRLKAEQLAKEAEASDLRQTWAEAINYDPDKIVRTEFDNKLIEAVRAEDNHSYTRHSTDGGETWSNWAINNLYSKKDDIKFAEVDGKLFQVIRHPNNLIYVRHTSNGKDWTGWSILGGPVAGEFNVDTIGDRAVISMRRNENYNRVYTRAINANNWQPWQYAPVTSLNDIEQEVIGKRLIQSFKGVDGKTYLRHTEDGVNWTDWESPESAIAQSDWRLENLPAVRDESLVTHTDNVTQIEFKGKLVEAVTAPNKAIYNRTSSDGGKNWTDWKHIKAGFANSTSQMVALGDTLFQVVKGINNAIYIRRSTDGDNWTDWGRLSGDNMDDFEISAIDNRLVLSVRGTDNHIYTRSAQNGIHWSSSWNKAPVASIDGFSQKIIDGQLVQSYRGTDDKIYNRQSEDGLNWTNWTSRKPQANELPIESQNVEQVAFGDKVVQAVTAPNKATLTRHSLDDGKTWTAWEHIGGGFANSDPQMLTSDDTLFQVVKGIDNAIYISRSIDGENWMPWAPLTGPFTSRHEIDIIGDRLVLNVRGSDHKSYTRYSSPGGTSWPPHWLPPSPQIMGDVYQETVEGKLVQVYRGMDNRIYNRYTEDGVNWSNWESNGEAIATDDWRKDYLTNLDPAVTLESPITRREFNGKLVETTLTNSHVYGRHSEDGGQTWTDWRGTSGWGLAGEVQMLEMGVRGASPTENREASPTENRLIQIGKTTDGVTWTRSSADGVNWPLNWTKVSNATVGGEMDVKVINDQLVFAWRHTDNRLRTVQMTNGVSWSENDWSPTQTLDDFSQEIIDGKLVQSYQGTDGQKYVRHTPDGKDWSEWATVDAALDQAQWRRDEIPDVARETSNLDLENAVSYEFQGRTVQLVRDAGDVNGYVYQRTSADGGKTWTDWTYSHMRSNPDDIKILATDNRLFQVVRHPSNNIVYVRHSTDGENWSGWIKTANNWGTTGDFEADVIDDELVIGVRYNGNNHVYTRSFDGTRWKPWDSASHPALQEFSQELVEGRLIQTYRGLDDIAYTRHTPDGENWTDWTPIDEVLATSKWEQENIPDVKDTTEKLNPKNIVRTEFDNKLVEVSLSPDNYIYDRYSTDGGATWSQWKQNQASIGREGGLRFFQVGDKLFQVQKNDNNRIYYRHSQDGQKWSYWNDADVGATEGDYRADVIGDTLVISALHSNDLIYSRPIVNGQEKTRTNSTVKTLADFHQEVIDGRIVQSYRGIDDKLYARHSSDGLDWTDWTPIEETPATSDWEKAHFDEIKVTAEKLNPKNIVRTEFDNKLVEVSLSPDNYIYDRYSTDGGATWSQWKQNQASIGREGGLRFFQVGDKLFQVQKNDNNRIYYRHSQDGQKWSYWNDADVGATEGDYRADVIGDTLVISALHSNDLIYSRPIVNGQEKTRTNSTVKTLADFHQEVIDGRIVQSYRGIDDKLYARHSSDGLDWTDWTPIEETPATSDWEKANLGGIKATAEKLNPKNIVRTEFDSKLVEVSLSPDNYIYDRYSTDGGATWSQWKQNQASIGREGGLRFFQVGDKLFQVQKNHNKNIYYRYSEDGQNWGYWYNADVGATEGDYQADVIGDTLVISALHSNDLIYSLPIVSGQKKTRTNSTVKTLADFHQEVIDGRIVQSYRGIDDKLYARHSSDGLDWTDWTPIDKVLATSKWEQENVPDVKTDFEAIALENLATTEFDGRLIQTVRDSRGYVYRRHSADNGSSWTDWQYANMLTQEDNVRTVQVGERLFHIYKHPNNNVYAYDSLDGINWRFRGLIGGPSEGDYAIDVVGDELVFTMRHAGNNKIYTKTVNTRGMSGWDISKVPTVADIQQTVENGTITQTYLGTDDNIYTRESADGKTWSEWYSPDIEARDLRTQKEGHLVPIVSNSDTLLRPTFIDNNPENGTAIETLQEETAEQRDAYQQQLNQAEAEQEQNSAQSSAALAQADWYEKQAAKHWQFSRKNGPYWYEWRKTYKRKWNGKKKTKWVRVVHIDHHWILWNTYTQYAKQLRAQGVNQLIASQEGEKEQERLTPLVNQWTEANNAANEAAPSILATRNLLEVLEAAREQIPQTKEQIELLGELLPEELRQDLPDGDVEIETLTPHELLDLLPDLRADLELARREAETYQEKVNDDWDKYDSAAANYNKAVTAILERRGEVDSSAQTLQQELADSEAWVERQSVALGTELSQVRDLRQELQKHVGVLREAPLQDPTKLAQLQRSLDLLENKEAVLAAEQAALTQKRVLLAAQNEVILAEQRLLDAYLESPDEDLGTLQQQLQDARAALAEAQRLAEQAEASSKALTAPLQELQANLLAQNDEHLKAAKQHQAILKDLLEATELHANYSLEAAQKQQQVNDLEFQILQRLQEATEAGSQEAKHLLDVATNNDMATAAELYYRDYNDLASDKGGGCSGGIARPEDRILANRYYGQMLHHRQLQQRAQAQANHFGQIRQAAEAAMSALQAQQTEAQERLNELSKEIATTEEEKTRKEQELAVAQARLDGISRIRQQTEQTFVQLVTLEKLNLAQAQLEQQIAKQRQQDIETAVQQRLDREKLELERQRLAARAKLEQLYQLQAEGDLQEALNEVRNDLGLENLEDVEEPAQLQSQMAALLGQLQSLESQQPDLPENLKALLADARGDLHLALQGKEAETIQENLLKATEGLVGQVQHYQTEIARLDLEEQQDNQLLAVAENNLQAASREFVEELQKAELLQGERSIIDPLYIETLTKVAYADQAVEISQELAQQSKEMFEEILEQRKIERKARKKAFWNELLSVVSTVIGIISTVLMLIPASAPFAALASQIGLGLALVAGGISATQAAINGDWLGAVFSAVMAAASFVGGSFGSALKLAKEGATKVAVFGAQIAKETAQRVQATISSLSALASGAFNGVRSALSGDSILGFLQVLGGVAGATVSSLGSTLAATSTGQLGYKVLQSMTNAPAAIYSSIKAIENGDLVSGIGTIVKTVASLAKVWANDFQEGQSGLEKFADILENIGYSAVGVAKFVTGGFKGLLDGLGDIIDGLGDNIGESLENLFKKKCLCNEDNLLGVGEENENSRSSKLTQQHRNLIVDKKVLQFFLVHQENNGHCTIAAQNFAAFLYKEGEWVQDALSMKLQGMTDEDFKQLDIDMGYLVDSQKDELIEYAEAFKTLNEEGNIIAITQEEADRLPKNAIVIPPYKRPGNTGAPPQYIGLLMHDLGIPVTQTINSTKEDLIHELSQGKPVVVGVHVSELPYWNFNSVRDGHIKSG